MTEELKKALLELGLNDEQIGKLETEGVKTNEDLAMLSSDEIKGITGCGLVIAKKVAKAFGAPPPQETASQPAAATTTGPATGQPMNITVRSGNPEDMTVQELLILVRDGERSTDITQVLRRKVGTNRRVYVREPGGDKLDVAETMELINQDFEAGQEPPFWGSVPTETLNEILQMRQYADPLTGAQLAKGDPWLKLGDDDKIAAFAYAKMKGVLTGAEDKYTLVNEATAGGERWNRIQSLWSRGVKSSDPQIMEARAAITYKTSRGTNRKESEYRNRGRSEVSVQGGRQTGDGFRDNEQ